MSIEYLACPWHNRYCDFSLRIFSSFQHCLLCFTYFVQHDYWICVPNMWKYWCVPIVKCNFIPGWYHCYDKKTRFSLLSQVQRHRQQILSFLYYFLYFEKTCVSTKCNNVLRLQVWKPAPRRNFGTMCTRSNTFWSGFRSRIHHFICRHGFENFLYIQYSCFACWTLLLELDWVINIA